MDSIYILEGLTALSFKIEVPTFCELYHNIVWLMTPLQHALSAHINLIISTATTLEIFLEFGVSNKFSASYS